MAIERNVCDKRAFARGFSLGTVMNKVEDATPKLAHGTNVYWASLLWGSAVLGDLFLSLGHTVPLYNITRTH